MPVPITNDWSLRKLLQNTYINMPNRFEYKERDVIRRITIRKIDVYQRKGRRNYAPGEQKTKYVITSYSYPQYPPYKLKSQPRPQRKYRHEYNVTIQLDRLSIDAPPKLRTGADRKWRFNSKTKVRRDSRGRRHIEESENIRLGINGDFFFRLSYLYQQEGILFGRNFADGAPTRANPGLVIFLDKHMIATVEKLMEAGVLGEG